MHTSKRKYKIAMFRDDNDIVLDYCLSLDTLFSKKKDSEFIYALRDQLDRVLDLRVNETMSFLHNRDDKNSNAILKRIE